ncbi:MAG: hypothetical protein ACYS9X_24895 [Planctomycetota bacterium]|jgi:hypothetical protein
MDEEKHPAHEPPSPHARFPWVQAAFCAACVGMAAWLWMRYSYRWDVSPRDFWMDTLPPGYADHYDTYLDVDLSRRRAPDDAPGAYPNTALVGRYVRVRGRYVPNSRWYDGLYTVRDPMNPDAYVVIGYPLKRALPEDGAMLCISGRVGFCSGEIDALVLWPDESRWRPEAIAGLVVSAMGVFIFVLHLHRWLKERGAAT